MEKFYLDDYLKSEKKGEKKTTSDFYKLCKIIEKDFRDEWEQETERIEEKLEVQKRAIIGYDAEVNYFKGKIRQLVKSHDLADTTYPNWYDSLEDGIYHENWGMAAISEWFLEKYKESSSAKVIGDRIYFLENGKMVLKKQTITSERREQLIRAFLLLTPEERLDKDCHEIYLKDGTRITVFRNNMVKKGEDVIVFRRYVIPSYTFEEQARRGTIPYAAVPLFKSMVAIGYNVAFLGAVRTAKSTFLSTWQSYEDNTLEGVMVETDPELPLHKIMKTAPIVQLLADGEQLSRITKNLLRSDADYFILAEARDGIALDTAIKVASKGTRRMKITFHTRDPIDFPYDAAAEIVKSCGGEIEYTARKVASSFDYLFHFVQLTDKSKKRLKSIHEISLDKEKNKIVISPICNYNFEEDNWIWHNNIGKEKHDIGVEENKKAFMEFEDLLNKIAEK